MSVMVPEVSKELYDAINSGTAQITRRVEIYESDGVTRWDADTPATIKEGQVTVNYGGDEERRACDFTFTNTDGSMTHDPRGFWYDKIIKPFRGIKYQRPESYETTVLMKAPIAFWRVMNNYYLFERVAGVTAVASPNGPIEVVTSHNSHWDQYDQAARLRILDNLGFRTTNQWGDITWPSDSLTIETWIRPRSSEPVNKVIFRCGNFILGIRGSDDSIYLATQRDGSFITHQFNDDYISKQGLGKWFHVAVTIANNFQTTTSVHTLYVNGTPVKTVSLNGVVINTQASWASFGYDDLNQSGWGNIDIADIALYGIALTEAELWENYAVGTDDRIVTRNWETQVGEFMIDSINASNFPHDIKVTGRDYTKKLIKIKFNEAVTFSEGTSLDVVIEAVARNGGITKFRLGADGYALEADAAFDRTTERWSAIKDMADATGVEVFFDAQGFLVTRPFLDPTTSPEAITLQVGRDGNLNTYSYSSSDSRIYNKVVVTGENPDDMEEGNLYSGIAENNNPNSPTNIQALGERTLFHSSALFTSDAQCRRFALELLKVSALEEFDFNFTSLVFAWLEVGEIIRTKVDESPDTIPDRYLLSSITIPFTLTTMTGVGKRVVSVESDNPFPRNPGQPNDIIDTANGVVLEGGFPLFVDNLYYNRPE